MSATVADGACDVVINIVEDRPASGMWHCGPNACWITVTHLPTKAQVRVYSGGVKSQHRTRQNAMELLAMMIAEHGDEPCMFPERIAQEE